MSDSPLAGKTDGQLVQHVSDYAGNLAKSGAGQAELTRRSIEATRVLTAATEALNDQMTQQGQVLAQLVRLAELERDARLASERSSHRWQIVFLVLGVLTFAAAVAAIVATIAVAPSS